MADKRNEEQKQLDQELDDALDWDGSGTERSRGSYDDEPWEDDKADESKEEDAGEEAATEEGEDEEVATKEEEESTESDDSEDDEAEEGDVTTFTIDGKKYTSEEIASDPKLLSKMATHYNQVGHFQKLLDEERANLSARDASIAQLEQEKQAIEREWIKRKMAEDNEREAQKQKAEAPKPRPNNKTLQHQLKPYFEQLKADGRLTEDELEEHGGLIAEYMYDYANMQRLVESVAVITSRALGRIDELEGFVNPAVQKFGEQEALRYHEKVQKEAAAIEGYEELADPENWEKLIRYISEKVAASPQDEKGRPQFDPIFDPETMAQQWDAMQGPVLRKALAEQRKKAEAQMKSDAKMAGGSATSGGKTPKKKPKQKGAPTPTDDALDWGDGRYAV